MRMVAKIGYGYAIAELGYGSFRPLILGAILKEDGNPSYLVGQNEKTEPPEPGAAHILRVKDQSKLGKKPIITSEVRLFSTFQTPTYHVIVGEIDSPEQHIAIIEKLNNRRMVNNFPS